MFLNPLESREFTQTEGFSVGTQGSVVVLYGVGSVGSTPTRDHSVPGSLDGQDAERVTSLRYAGGVRYPEGGGLTAERRAFREGIRLQAGERFVAGEKTAVIAKELRVSVRSVERRRRAWREGGMEALRSAGPANAPAVTDAQFAVLEEELGKDRRHMSRNLRIRRSPPLFLPPVLPILAIVSPRCVSSTRTLRGLVPWR
ncbi:helix-turn-helix domain-containing protein [Streptomyces sp. NPDC060333]|uniref:helix-turn-helix domain-containing protein n=1 Tax=Streptomyces sp. NPDC060333 TaxID=3347098 RepID=UPI003663C790